MKNEIRFTLKSKQRPKLAQEIGNILGTAPHYERVPSCAYDIAGYRLDKEGVLHIPDGAEKEEDVAQMFQAIIEDRNSPKVEKSIDGYSGFLFYDDNGMPLVAMHWQHRFNHMVGRYNDIYRVQMPNITPHVCRHTYCSNMAKSGMNPKTLQYLMGHSNISVTMNVYTHIGFDDAEEELKRMEEFRRAQAEVEQKKEKPMSQKMFKVV